MKDFFKHKPWYYISILLSGFASKMYEFLIEAFFEPTKVSEILMMSINVKVKWIVTAGVALVILIICVGVHLHQINKKKKQCISENELEIINLKLENALSDFGYIESIQVYSHHYKTDREFKYLKVEFLTGAADERIEINSVMQTYFYIPHTIANKLKDFSNAYKIYTKSDAEYRNAAWKNVVTYGEEICSNIYDILNKLESTDEIKVPHYELYRILTVILPTIKQASFKQFLRRSDIENELIKGKRTGLLGSIILDDIYVFKNENSSEKCGRIYLTFPLTLAKHLIVLVALNCEYFSRVTEGNMKEYYSSIINYIEEINEKKGVDKNEKKTAANVQ